MLFWGTGGTHPAHPLCRGGSLAFPLEMSRSHGATEEQITSGVEEPEFALSSEARALEGRGPVGDALL